MKQTYTKSFIKLWVSQMVTNNAFIQDKRITKANIGAASLGDLPSLRAILEVYENYIDQPIPQAAYNLAPDAPERKQRDMREVLPIQDRSLDIREFISLIDQGVIEIV